jgi:signal transduction histidine kinase
MAADRLWKFLVSSFTAMLNSLKTSLNWSAWSAAAPKINSADVPRTPAPDRDLTDMEILDVLQAVHDLRNQLMVMRLATNDLLEDSPNRAERLDQLQRSVERAAVLINALLLDEQSLLPRRAHVDANEVVRRTATTLSLSPSEAIRLQLVLWPAPLAVVADAGDLDRILLNLVFNAFDAMPDGGVLTIETAISDVRGWANAGPRDQYARLTIRDTGCGMAPEVKDRIFDPFFTTKQSGTGLGLRSVAFTVEQLHGRISVESEPGRGTSVTVLLPLAAETPVLNFPDRLSDSHD